MVSYSIDVSEIRILLADAGKPNRRPGEQQAAAPKREPGRQAKAPRQPVGPHEGNHTTEGRELSQR
jgi:hypothetical protein